MELARWRAGRGQEGGRRPSIRSPGASWLQPRAAARSPLMLLLPLCAHSRLQVSEEDFSTGALNSAIAETSEPAAKKARRG